MSNFIYVLAAGVAILVVGGILAGYVGDVGPRPRGGDVIFSESLGTIGSTESTSRTAFSQRSLTVEASSPNATVVSRDTLRASRGLLGGGNSETLEFEGFDPEKIYIEFVPTRSSAPRNLVVMVNGEEVPVESLEEGTAVTLTSNNLERGTNVVRIEARDPGLTFWNSPRYVLDNFRIVLHDIKNTRVIETFEAEQQEVQGFSRGLVSFQVGEDVRRENPLEMRMNGQQVFSFSPIKRALPYEITFSANETGLRPGENVITLSTSGQSVYPLSNFQVELFFFAGTQRHVLTRDFHLSSREYNRIEGGDGRISFDVQRVLLQSPMTIDLTNRSFTRDPSPGTNQISFGQDAVVQGENSLSIATSGAYRIGNFNISVADG